MMKRLLMLAAAGLFGISCSSEKVSLSPIYDLNTDTGDLRPESFGIVLDEIFYASEITGQVSSFPKFENHAINKEIGVLKSNLKDYVVAVRSYDARERKSALKRVQKSYYNIEGLRNYMQGDDSAVISRYLVRIKGNISQIEHISSENTIHN